MAISSDLMNKILPLLRPLMENANQRKAYLFRALGTDTPVQHRLALNIPTNDFIPNLVNELVAYGEISSGKPALCALLKVIREDVGIDVQGTIDALIVEFLPPATQTISTPPHVLFDLLLQVDFKEQTNIVREVMRSYITAGFLVHNEPDCGLEFLLAKLFRMKPSLKNNKPIVFDVDYRNIERLWTRLGRYFHVHPISPSEILEKICDRWQTQDVVFIFNKVDCLQPEVLSTWLKEFWEPLVNMGKENPPQKSTHLFMFLVDHGGKVHQSNMKSKTSYPLIDPRIPLYLPPVNSFSQEIIEEWITEVVMQRSDIEIEFDKLTSEILFQKSCQGIPQFVFEEICSFFSINSEKVFEQCTKI